MKLEELIAKLPAMWPGTVSVYWGLGDSLEYLWNDDMSGSGFPVVMEHFGSLEVKEFYPSSTTDGMPILNVEV